MEEIEVPLEHAQEHIHEHAHNGGWMGSVALSTAIIAVVAAISALMAGHHSNEALISQIQSSDHWSYFQAKGIKSSILSAKNDLLIEMGKQPKESDIKKVSEYKKEQEDISSIAKEKEHESAHHLKSHVVLAKSVTFFQIAIAISAIAVLTRRKTFWYVSLGVASVGIGFFIQGFFFI